MNTDHYGIQGRTGNLPDRRCRTGRPAESSQGLRRIFARRDLQAELKKYDRVTAVLGRLHLHTLYLEKSLVDDLTKPEPLNELAWLNSLLQESQSWIVSSEYGHRFRRDPDPETYRQLREELNKTALGQKTVKILDRNGIEVVFAAPLQSGDGSISRGGYMPGSRKLWLAYCGIEDMAGLAIHEATHVDQESRHPGFFKFYSLPSLRGYSDKVNGYVVSRLAEAQAYAAMNLYQTEKSCLYAAGSPERAELLSKSLVAGFKDTDEDFSRFLLLRYFGANLHSLPGQELYESIFIDSAFLFYSNLDFAACVLTSPYAKTEFLERFCVDADGECFLPSNPQIRKDVCYKITRLLCDPIMLRKPRMTCMPRIPAP